MANQVGTASNFEDFITRIINFLTTDPVLVAANQHWEVLRVRRDNILAHTSNITDGASGSQTRQMIHTFRYDSRTLNVDNPASGNNHFFLNSGFNAGVSFNRWRLRQARAVTTLRIRAHFDTLNAAPRTFRLQYSDDDVNWTTALTVTNTSAFSAGERRDFAVPGGIGAREYWRIIWDAVQSGTTQIGWSEILLLQADGTAANHFGSEVLLRGKGNGGSDNIYIGLRGEYDAAAGWHNLILNGYTGFNPNVLSWFEHPGALSGFGATATRANPMVPLWDSVMPYWFSASGRSFRFGVKVSTNYEGGYLGFILPYATPGQYPYPLAVGGSLVPNQTTRSADWRYSTVSFRHGVFPGPGCSTTLFESEAVWGSLYLRDPAGDWRWFGNRPQQNVSNPEGVNGPSFSGSPPFPPIAGQGGWRNVWPHCMNDFWTVGKRPYRECLGGGYILQPCVLLQRAPAPAVFGEFEGVYSISGFQNSAENTTTFGGKTHVVFQNAYRNAVHEFWALSLD